MNEPTMNCPECGCKFNGYVIIDDQAHAVCMPCRGKYLWVFAEWVRIGDWERPTLAQVMEVLNL